MRTRSAWGLLGFGLAALVACGRADVEDWEYEMPSSGAGARGPSPSGSGGAPSGSGGVTSGAGAGTGQGGSGGGQGGSGGVGGAGGAGGGQGGSGGYAICPSYNDPCSPCLANSCPEVWCGCYDNPECIALLTCTNGCNGDAGCDQGCMAAHEGGISDLYLVSDCAATACEQECGGGQDLDVCTECLATDCEDELNACIADVECLDLYDCLDGCGPSDLSCQQACYNDHGAGVPSLEALLQCADTECPDC